MLKAKKTISSRPNCKEEVLSSNTQGKSRVQERVQEVRIGLFCKLKSETRWMPKKIIVFTEWHVTDSAGSAHQTCQSTSFKETRILHLTRLFLHGAWVRRIVWGSDLGMGKKKSQLSAEGNPMCLLTPQKESVCREDAESPLLFNLPKNRFSKNVRTSGFPHVVRMSMLVPPLWLPHHHLLEETLRGAINDILSTKLFSATSLTES